MSLVRMRSDIKPLCDVHHRPMTLVHLLWQVGSDVGTRAAFACEEKGCRRHYDIIHGYYTICKDHIERETKTHVACCNDELPMYLREYELQGSVGHWMCAEFGCEGGKQTRGPAQ